MSAITQVKVLSPEINIIALGQGFQLPEASIAACVQGEHARDVPGSEAMAGIRTVDIGTWENPMAAKASLQSRHVGRETRWRYGGRVVGSAHSRGVAGVMPGASEGSLEGTGGKSSRAAAANTGHRTG